MYMIILIETFKKYWFYAQNILDVIFMDASSTSKHCCALRNGVAANHRVSTSKQECWFKTSWNAGLEYFYILFIDYSILKWSLIYGRNFLSRSIYIWTSHCHNKMYVSLLAVDIILYSWMTSCFWILSQHHSCKFYEKMYWKLWNIKLLYWRTIWKLMPYFLRLEIL